MGPLIDRRSTLAGLLAATTLAASPLRASAAPLSARAVFAEIKRASGQPWDPNPNDDRIIFGDRSVPVTGIATCFTATLDILRRAQVAGLNYVIPHEASFYERYDDFAESALRDDDPVLQAKTRFLTTERMVIQRMHLHAHTLAGDPINTGLLRQLGWEIYRVNGRAGPPWVELPPTTAREAGRHIKQRLGRQTLRLFGDPNRTISTISISAGMPGENLQIQQLESGADAVLLGEVREPEVLGYAQDMAASRQTTVYLVGHTNEDPGMGILAEWLRTVFPALPVTWLPLADPYINPS